VCSLVSERSWIRASSLKSLFRVFPRNNSLFYRQLRGGRPPFTVKTAHVRHLMGSDLPAFFLKLN
jgi:hypothetical protein